MQKVGLTKKKKLGYAFGILTESLIYNMYYTYFLTFLVQVVRIKPDIAGMVIFVSIAWDAITDPILGYICDKPGTDKRRLMIKSLLPLALCFMLAWSTLGNSLFGDSQALKMVFYTLVSMMIWLFYTMYTIPYYAVVAELTEDYDERTEIRSTASLINAAGIGMGNILPAIVGGAITYFVVSGIISVLAVLFGLVCVISLKGVYTVRALKSAPVQAKRLGSAGDTVRSYAEILKLPPVKYFLLFVFFFLAGSSMLQSNLSYMVVNCIGFDYGTGIAVVIAVLVVSMAVTVPLVSKISEKTDRRTACLIFISIAAAAMVLMKIVGLDSEIAGFRFMIVVAPFILGLGLSTFWTVFYAMSYDIVELDEFVNSKNGERRESIVTALPQLMQKLGSGVGIMLQGFVLGFYGYNTASETGGDAALFVRPSDYIVSGMENVSTVIPAALIGIGLVFLVLYPMTRGNYNLLLKKLEEKREGKPIDTGELSKLVK